MSSTAKDNPAQSADECPHILIVDDDARIRDLVVRFLEREGYLALSAHDSAYAKELLQSLAFDVLIVDIMMPGQDGLAFTEDLRANGVSTPVIFLTALGETDDRIRGFESGGDDYLPKPFEPRELQLRLSAMIRRLPKYRRKSGRVMLGEWEYRKAEEMLRKDDRTEKLTSAEVTLIDCLLGHNHEIVGRDVLAEVAGIDPDSRAVDVQVTRLRRKLGDDSRQPRILQTVRGQGYRLRAEVFPS